MGGGELGGGEVGTYFFPEKYENANKIYQIELRLKEMTCLMSITETKKIFSAFQSFH